MTYLVLQMALYLVIAVLTGMALGWWLNHLRNQSQITELLVNEDEDGFAIKSRLDKCFDDNAMLRRDLKLRDAQLQKAAKNKISVYNGSNDSLLEERIEVLMNDLQLRDDTISVLEKELEVSRNNNS